MFKMTLGLKRISDSFIYMNSEPIQGTEWTDSNKTYWKWHLAKYGDPYSEFVLCVLPIQSARARAHTHTHLEHTQLWTHTHTHTHTEQWPAIYAAAPGEQLWVRCLAQGHLGHGIEGGESAVHSPPHQQFLPDQDSNPWPLDYKSDSLPSGHNFPECPLIIWTELVIYLFTWTGWII